MYGRIKLLTTWSGLALISKGNEPVLFASRSLTRYHNVGSGGQEKPIPGTISFQMMSNVRGAGLPQSQRVVDLTKYKYPAMALKDFLSFPTQSHLIGSRSR